MTAVAQREVASDEAGIRLDRWFKRHFPALPHGQLERLLRTGQIRVDGGRAKAGHRLAAGQIIRVPPLAPHPGAAGAASRVPSELDRRDSKTLQSLVLAREDDLVVINKPAGLAVQGGTRTTAHVDRLIDAHEAVTGERLKLVHRLDRDTSGLLVLARGPAAAAALTAAFRARETRKLYWALTAGLPRPERGRIDLALAKRADSARQGREAMRAVEAESPDAQRAITDYTVLGHAGRIAWVALRPVTGRTHQLRAHMAALGTPILGDRKYGGEAALIGGALPEGLMLHARSLVLPGPSGRPRRYVAPPGPALAEALRLLGFDATGDEDPFD